MRNFINKLLKVINILFNFYTSNELKKIQRADVLFVCADENLTYLHNGKKYSPLIHSIYEDLEKLNFKVSLINRSASKYSSRDIFGTAHLINNIYKYYNLLISFKYWVFGDIEKVTHYSLFLNTELWKKILLRAKPKYIIGIQPPLELCIASNMLKIGIADLQHGIFSDEGYYGEKYRDCCNQLGWPDHILCWDVESKEWLDKNIGKYVESMVIGNPWINRFIVKEKRDQLVNNEFNKFIRKFDNRPAILVSLQYGEDIDNLNFIGIPNGLFEYFKKNGSRFNWFFRIHPIVLNSKSFTEINENFKSLFSGCDNVEWLECSKVALPIVLLKTKLHITWNSAVTLEASKFKVKTAVLNSESFYIFDNYKDIGFVDFVNNNSFDIDIWINKNLDSVNKNISPINNGYSNFIDFLVGLK